MPLKRPDLTLRQSSGSTSASTSAAVSSPLPSAATTSPASPLSPVSSQDATHSLNAIRSPTRSITFDSLFTRSRSKSPAPRPAATSPGPRQSKIAATAPVPQRHKSESAIGSPLEPSHDASFFQKRRPEKGSLDHYGRRSNDWLFGGISFRETAKAIVKRRDS